MKKSRFMTFICSFVPGGGHMYLGLMRQGIQLMTLFFGTITFIVVTGLGILGVIIPIIWFYSMFDALHKASVETPLVDEDIEIFKNLKLQQNPFSNISIDQRWIGYGLIGIGAYVLLQKFIIGPLENFIGIDVSHYLGTFIISALFIYVGYKVIISSQVVQQKEEKVSGSQSSITLEKGEK